MQELVCLLMSGIGNPSNICLPINVRYWYTNECLVLVLLAMSGDCLHANIRYWYT